MYTAANAGAALLPRFNRPKDCMIPALFSMAALLAVAVLAVVLPLWRPARSGPLGSRESNLVLWRSERRSIDEEFHSGVLSAGERDDALAQVAERAAAEVLPEVPDAPAVPARAAKRLALVLGTLVVGGSVALYGFVGDTDRLLAAAGVASRPPADADPKVLAMVDSLAEKMRARPGDAQGWKLLGRSQFVLGRYRESVEAYAHAAQLAPQDAELLADYADALAMSRGGRLDGVPEQLIQQALTQDPKNLKALELAGTVEVARHNAPGAIQYWERLERLLPAGSEDAQQVAAALTALRAQVAAQGPGGTTAPAGGAPAAAASARAPAAAPATAAAATGTSISGRVDISPALASRVALSDTVFVYARATQGAGAGSRMPLAVMRFAARELPRNFELTDAMAMAPDHRLSGAAAVVVEARVSKSGNALPASGDLVGTSPAIAPGARGVTLLINSTVP